MKKHLLYFVSLLFSSPIIQAQDHLLLSEVTLAPATGEFIEIYNPTSTTVSLDNYYLADNMKYARLPEGGLTMDTSDFIVRFPSGAIIEPNSVKTIAIGGTDFNTTYLIDASFEILSQSSSVQDMITIASSTPSLTNAGEAIILFYWNGTSDNVQDVDMLNAGIPSATNQITSKTGLAVDGPDVDALATNYFVDNNTIPLQASAPGAGLSTKRILPETDYETQTGGNGITGNDETTETTTTTWDHSPYTAPTPGTSTLGLPNHNNGDFITLYPNPVDSNLIFATNINQEYELEIYNSIGVKILKRVINQQESVINIEQFATGIYHYKVSSENSTVKTGKIIKR